MEGTPVAAQLISLPYHKVYRADPKFLNTCGWRAAIIRKQLHLKRTTLNGKKSNFPKIFPFTLLLVMW